MILLLVPLVGLAVSFVSVFLGLGGGILLVPLLPLLFGLDLHSSVATTVFTISLVVLENTYRFQKKQWVSWPVVIWMAPAAALASFSAARLSAHLDERILLILLLILMGAIGLRTLLFAFFAPGYEPQQLTLSKRILLVLGGGVAGLTSGLVGVGSGVIQGPMMIYLKVVKPVQLTPTSNANMVFTTLFASFGFLWGAEMVSWNQFGLIRWDVSLGIFTFASLFSHFLRPWQNHLPFRVKSLLLGLVLLALNVRVCFQLNLFSL